MNINNSAFIVFSLLYKHILLFAFSLSVYSKFLSYVFSLLRGRYSQVVPGLSKHREVQGQETIFERIM